MSEVWTKFTCPRCQRTGSFDLIRTQEGFACSDCTKTTEAMSNCSSSTSTNATYNPTDPLGDGAKRFSTGRNTLVATTMGGA